MGVSMARKLSAGVVLLGIMLSATVVGAAGQSKAIKTKASAAQAADKNRNLALWEKAAEVYKAAYNVYKLGDWEKAAEAFEGFIELYSTNENIPLAYLQLADCQFKQGNTEAGLAKLDELIKKFPASKAAFYASCYKLNFMRFQNKLDDFLKYYPDFIKLNGGLAPLYMDAKLDWRNSGEYYWRFDHVVMTWPYVWRIGYSLELAPEKLGQVSQLLEVGNTPARAAQLLKILDASLKKMGKTLPTDWKFAHILLLRKAGRAGQADSLYNKYLKDWPANDPRRMGLMLFQAEWAQAQPVQSGQGKEDSGDAKDQPVDYQKQADEIYETLVEKFPGWTTLGNRLPGRLQYLFDQHRYDEFRKLASWYLAKFPAGGWRAKCISLLVDQAKALALSGDTSQMPSAIEILEKEANSCALDPQAMRENFVSRVELYMELGQADKAIELARELIGSQYWSAETLSQLVALAVRYDPLKKIETDAREKYGVPSADPNSQAAGLLANLKKRIATNKVRHMEEIGEEMFDKYHKDANTIEAMKLLVEYFFNKALHQQRDKWSEMMIKAYRYHPMTQDVLALQITAEKGARNFSRLAGLTDTAMKNFPGAADWNKWFSYRVECFESAEDQDHAEAPEYVTKKLDARAKAGEIFAISWIAKVETERIAAGQQKERGDYWMKKARQWQGKQQEIYCLEHAFEAYYLYPCRRWWWGNVDFPGATKAIIAMQKQTLSPELRWKTQFDDINMMAHGGFGNAEVKTLAKRLKSNRLSYRLSELLDLGNVGMAIGNEKASGQAGEILSQLKARCKNDRLDNNEYIILNANMFSKDGRNVQAANAFLQAAKFYTRPIDRWVLEVNAINALAGTENYVPAISKYSASIKSAQDMIPRLLLWAGSSLAKKNQTKKQAMSYLLKLRKNYPASSQRGDMEEKIKQ